MKRIVFIFIALILLYGCLTTDTPETNVKIINDEFKPVFVINGIKERLDFSSYYFIRTIVDKKSHAKLNQIYIKYVYSGKWRFYELSYAKGGEQLDFVKIDRDFDVSKYGTDFTEQFAINLPDGFLENNSTGFQVKIIAKSGHELIIDITELQIKKQLEAISQNPL